MNNLSFVTAGTPHRADGKGYKEAFEVIKDLNLDGMEIEFVHGVRISDSSKEIVKNAQKNEGLIFTAHGPYYINLNAKEEEKIDASIKRILDTAIVANELGAYSITFHAAFYMGKSKEVVFENVKKAFEIITGELEKQNNKIWIRPETTGKGTQWGDIDEVINISKYFDTVLPCVDFAHLHARSNGDFNTYDEFCNIFEKIGNTLGDKALNNFHAHIAGINYSEKGEKNHLILEESDMNYKDLLKAFKSFNVKGVIVCESPNIEDDTKLLKEYYMSL